MDLISLLVAQTPGPTQSPTPQGGAMSFMFPALLLGMVVLMLLLAQTTTPSAPAGPTQPGAGGAACFLPAQMVAMIAFFFMSSRSQKKREKRERDQMHAGLSKNDRVLTIGGVIGTIISVKDNEVVLKVDESTNTKMTFLKTAIQRKLDDDQPADLKKL